ncbi:hypothetical protein [Streptomyces sp. NPDC101165]|uniref:hypothetical protein n=1 Tax=Streptomyces sp. NPDC101165 TaxID=3366119 RepID=UPI0038269578
MAIRVDAGGSLVNWLDQFFCGDPRTRIAVDTGLTLVDSTMARPVRFAVSHPETIERGYESSFRTIRAQSA